MPLNCPVRHARQWFTAALVLQIVPLAALAQLAAPNRVELSGRLTVTVYCYFDEGRSVDEYSLETSDGQSYILRLREDHTAPDPGATVQVTGRIDGRTLHVDTIEQTAGPLAHNPTIGEQKLCVLLINFQDDRTENVTKEQVERMLFDPNDSADRWWREASFEKMWLTGDVYGWYTLPMNRGCDPGRWRSLAIEMADDEVFFPQYNRLFILVPTGGGCGWGGLGTLNPSILPTDDGPWETTTSWCRSEYYNTPRLAVAITTHEGGHNLGQHHARAIGWGGGEALGEFDCNACGRSTLEYGDRFDALGLWDLGMYNTRHKMNLGWFDDENLIEVRSPGRFALTPFSVNNKQPKALKVFRGRGDRTRRDEWLYVEWRQPIGYDVDIDYYNGLNYNGVLFHYDWGDSGTATYLLDMTPGDGDWLDASLQAGSVWSDNYTDLSIEAVVIEDGRMIVDVRNGKPVAASGFTVTRGVWQRGDLQDLHDSDNERLVINARRSHEIAAASVELVVSAVSPVNTPAKLTFSLEAATNGTPVVQRIELFDYDRGVWEQVDERPAPAEDSVVDVTIDENPQRFVRAGTRLMKARIGYHDRDVTFASWEGRFDRVIWWISK